MIVKEFRRAESFEPRLPTLGLIAELAGVSKSTVSLALRNSSKIQKETCQRIQAIAQEMNYRPHPLVAAQMAHIRLNTRRKTTPTLAFINIWNSETDSQELSWSKVSKYYKGVEKRAISLGFLVDRFEFDRIKYSDRRIQEVLHGRGIDGLVFAPSRLSTAELKLNWEEFAISAIGCFESRNNVHRFFYDSFVCIQDVMNLLRKRSYNRVGFVTNQKAESQTGHLLSGGYLEYQSRLIPSESQIPLLRLPVPETPYCSEELNRICAWIKEHSPDAIIGIGSHLPEYLKSIGYRIPDDIGYVALGWSEDKLKGCACYYLSEEKVGAAAVDSLAIRLFQNERGLPECPITALLYGEFVEGTTLRKEGRHANKEETVCP